MSDNEVDTLKARLAEVERERDEAMTLAVKLNGNEELQLLMEMNNKFLVRAIAAEARVADLKKVLEPVVTLVADYIKHRMYSDDDLVVGRVSTPKDQAPPSITFGDLRRIANLAAEQKEAGK